MEIIESSPGFPQKTVRRLLQLMDGIQWPGPIDTPVSNPVMSTGINSQFQGIFLWTHTRLRILLIPLLLYRSLGANPFHALSCIQEVGNGSETNTAFQILHAEPVPWTPQTLAEILKAKWGPNYLGAAQALLDGNRVILPPRENPHEIAKNLLFLLPLANRLEIGLTLLPSVNNKNFQIQTEMPGKSGKEEPGAVLFSQAGDYPEGKFEYSLQWAVENEDLYELNRLYFRKTTTQVFWFACGLLAIVSLVPMALQLIKLLFP
ncbi:MAG: hypothetical protein EXR99_04400 [Gemmataceae bacterium]|nr:hypothetical protein [Gemmataceae bacterium]